MNIVVALLLALILGAILGLSIVIVKTMVETAQNMRKFKSKLGKIPFLDNYSLIGGHVSTVLFAPSVTNLAIKAHEEHGKYVACMYGTQPTLLTTDLDLIRTITVTEGQQHINRIPLGIPQFEFTYDCLLGAEDDQWRRIRRAFAPAMRGANFRTANIFNEIQSCIEKLKGAINRRLDAVEKKREFADGGEISVELDLDDIIHRYSLNLALTCFYKQTELIDFDASHDKMTDLTKSGLEELHTSKLVRLAVVLPALRPIVDWFILNFHPQGVWRKAVMDFVRSQTKLGLEARKTLVRLKASNKKMADEENFMLEDGTKFSRNMIDYVIDQYHDGKLTHAEYFNTSCFLLGAADVTVSDVLTHTIYQLAINRRVQEKLRQSVAKGGAESEYLAWTLNESMRLQPPVNNGSARKVKRDFPVEGGTIPAGTFVFLCIAVIHRLVEYWGPDADEFKPERFAKAAKFHPMQFMPFGAGIRACPGKEFAMHQLKQALSSLILEFKFQCEPKTNTDFAAPFMMFIIPYQHSIVRVSRVN